MIASTSMVGMYCSLNSNNQAIGLRELKITDYTISVFQFNDTTTYPDIINKFKISNPLYLYGRILKYFMIFFARI